jgi:hypothetical protein
MDIDCSLFLRINRAEVERRHPGTAKVPSGTDSLLQELSMMPRPTIFLNPLLIPLLSRKPLVPKD